MASNNLPTSSEAVKAVWARNFLQFRKTWIISIFWIVLEPVFVLGGIGYGLGAFVAQVQGMSYLEFFFPALLCNSTMMVAFFECTYANYTKLAHTKVYNTILLSPLDTSHVLIGEVLWGATKATFSAAGVILVAAVLGAMGSPRILLALPIIFLSSLIFATFGMLVTSLVRNYDQIIYPSSGLIIPLSLFSGTYFPIESLPKVLQYLAYLSPLTHAVAATRALQQGQFTNLVVLNIAFLFLLLTVLSRVTLRQFSRRLMK